MKPEDAPAAARAEVARMRAAGRYAEEDAASPGIDPVDRVSRAQLLEWALIEPDVRGVRSTRRAGAPITWLKRLLLRALRQYHNELTYQQTRLNLHLVRRVIELEDRLDELERRRPGA